MEDRERDLDKSKANGRVDKEVGQSNRGRSVEGSNSRDSADGDVATTSLPSFFMDGDQGPEGRTPDSDPQDEIPSNRGHEGSTKSDATVESCEVDRHQDQRASVDGAAGPGQAPTKTPSRDEGGSQAPPESCQEKDADGPGVEGGESQEEEEEAEAVAQADVLLCQVRLRPEAYPVTYRVGGLELTEGEWVVVPTDHGKEVGQVIKRPYRVSLPVDRLPRKVSRLATTSEIEDYYRNVEMEQKAWQICQRLCDSLGLDLKLVRVERFFDGSKIVFYYSADGRVDFRELVKGLVRELRMRVEMRQIGIRHEAKMIGGIGCCGRELCCASFLKGFDPISIKMAKAQNLPLNPSKISGFCGRLLCCLTFEYDTYKELAQDMPALGKACKTPDGQGKVVRHNIFKQAVTVMMPDGSFVEYQMDELSGGKRSEGASQAGDEPKNGQKQEARATNGQGDKGQKASKGEQGAKGSGRERGTRQKEQRQGRKPSRKKGKGGQGKKRRKRPGKKGERQPKGQNGGRQEGATAAHQGDASKGEES